MWHLGILGSKILCVVQNPICVFSVRTTPTEHDTTSATNPATAGPTTLAAGCALLRDIAAADPSEIRPVVPLWWILSDSLKPYNLILVVLFFIYFYLRDVEPRDFGLETPMCGPKSYMWNFLSSYIFFRTFSFNFFFDCSTNPILAVWEKYYNTYCELLHAFVPIATMLEERGERGRYWLQKSVPLFMI